MIEISQTLQDILASAVIEPKLVLEIDGLDTIFGSAVVLKYTRIGDPDLYIGDTWTIGGFSSIADQTNALSLDGTTTNLTQQLAVDSATGSSITSMQIALIDSANQISELISPGVTLTDMLGRKAVVYLSAGESAYPEDYVVIHRGIVDEIQSKPGLVTLNIAHPDQKKRQDIFVKASTALNGALNDSDVTITVDDTTDFLERVTGPDGGYDAAFQSYIRIDDEIIRYVGKTGTTFTTCTRGALGTTAVAHDDNAEVQSFYRITEDCVNLALKLMLSRWGTYFVTGVECYNFNYIDTTETETVANSIYFDAVNVKTKYGLVIGDYITTVGASAGANNVTLKVIEDIQVTDTGSYITISGVTFADEFETAATISFRSKYDVFPDGLHMSPDEVDVEEHELVYTRFLSAFEYDFYLKDQINGKEFIEKQLYRPAGAFSVPRKARSSIGYHIGPIPGSDIPILDTDNVGAPEKLTLRRATSKNFYNTIIYKFDVMATEDRRLGGRITTNSTSRTQIPVGTKALIIDADGLRTSLQGQTLAGTASNRRLNKYAFAAEYFDSVEVLYSDGFKIEIGDIVLFDLSGFQVTNTDDGSRISPARLYEVVNKSLDIKTGKVKLNLVDTSYSTANRYGLIAPSSIIKSVTSATVFVLEPSFSQRYGTNEYRKYERFTGCSVKIHSTDSNWTRDGNSTIASISGNTITLSASPGFTPQVGDIFEICEYTAQTDELKLIYVSMRDSAFGDGTDQFRMI